jgi:chromate transport protein ChrA
MRRLVATSAYAGGLVALTGLLAAVTGRPLIFPSLGPTAYVLATATGDEQHTARQVVGGHLVGVLAGLLAYHSLAAGSVITAPSATLAMEQFRLAASGVLAVTLTTAGMRANDAVHAPACATTLIVSLGLLASLVEVALIVLAVAVVFGAHRGIRRWAPLRSPVAT